MFLLDSELLPVFIVIGIAVIALAVFLLRKFIPGLGFENEEIDEKKMAEEEVNRYIVTEEIKEVKIEKNEEE